MDKSLQDAHLAEHLLVVFGLGLGLHGVGSATTWHTVEAQLSSFEAKLAIVAHLHPLGVDAIVAGKEGSGQLSCCYYGAAFGQCAEHTIKVRCFYDGQILVGSRPCGALDAQASIKKPHPYLAEKGFKCIETIGLVGLIDKVLLIIEEDMAEDTPHVVAEVGVIPRHTPPLGCWRKGAEHQQSSVLGEERCKGMCLNHEVSRE